MHDWNNVKCVYVEYTVREGGGSVDTGVELELFDMLTTYRLAAVQCLSF